MFLPIVPPGSFMTENQEYEKLSQEVRRLQKRVNLLTVVLAILVVLYVITDLSLLIPFYLSSNILLFALILLPFIAFLAILIQIDKRWGFGALE